VEHLQRFFFDVYFLTDGFEAPADRNCRVCGKIGHIAKDCPHSKANRRAEQKKEEEERRLGKETGAMTQTPFSARSRSASAPNKQGQDTNADGGTPLSTPQPKKIPSRQEANVSSVNHRSQPDSQTASPLKKNPDRKTEDGPENDRERVQPEIPHTQLPGQNLHTVVTSENLVSGSHETVLDTQVTSTAVKNETGVVNTIPSSGNVVTEPSGVRPLVHLPSPVNSGTRTAVGTSGTVTVQASHAGGVKPPPGFYIPDGTPQVSRISSEGPPPLMAGSIPHSPPLNMPPAGMFQGHPIILGTPPHHPPGMLSPQSRQLVGSPIQRDLWLRQQGGLMQTQHSPPVRPLVPYPLSPEFHHVHPQQQWRDASEGLPVNPQGSPLRGHQRLAEHNHQMIPHSPPNISRSVMWPWPPNSPPHNLGSYPDPAILREQHLPLPGHHPPFPGSSSPSVAPQQTQFPHGTPPGPPVGSPQQMPQLPPQGTILPPTIGTHMVSPPRWPYWFYY